MDEALSMVSAITGTTPEVARHFLSLTDGDAEQAIQLFYDSPDLSTTMAQDPPPPQPQQATSSGARGDSSNIINLDSDDEDDMAMDTEPDFEDQNPAAINKALHTDDDEAVARKMQEELYAGGDIAGSYDELGVRAPLARTTETLVGPGSEWTADEMHDAVLQQIRARTRPRPRQGRPGVFNQHGSPSSIWEESNPDVIRRNLANATGGESEASSKAARLAELFRPPFELMTRLPWDDVRHKGKDESKWIIVNVQDPSIFDCQSLNRDLWKHDGIKETIKESFIFLQYDKDDPRGNQYMQYYFPLRESEAAYPHIAIVDPRTGEQVKVWSGPPVPKPLDFLMQLYEFLDRYSLNVAVKNPVAKRKPEKSASIDVDKLTEEQMMDLALQNSLANGGAPGPKEHDPDDLTKSVGDLGKGKGVEAQEEQTPATSAFTDISSTVPHEEPAQDPVNTTRIQLRHSTGRVIRRFLVSDPVRRIYEWLKAEPIEGKVDVSFELKSMGADLIEKLNQSIGDAGLKNGTVMIEFLED